MSTPISKSKDLLGTSRFPSTQIEAPEDKASEKPANSVFAHVMLGCVLGVLFAVAITSPVRPKDEAAQSQPVSRQTVAAMPATAPAPIVAPEVRDLGAFSSGPGGLTGHLTATWSDKLSYQLEIGPSDPALSDAFAYTVAETHSPLPVTFELHTSAGQAICNQQVVLKQESNTESVKAAADSSSRAPAVAEGIFQNVRGRDGKIDSIIAQGIMPCTKQAFESVAAWSFAAQFPDLREQAALLQRRAAERVVAKATTPQAHPLMKAPEHHPSTASIQMPTPPAPSSVKLPPVPAVTVTQPMPPQIAETASAPQPFRFAVEGDDEIVDVDASQHSIQTTAGKIFLVREQLAAADGDGVLDELANIHYRCDQSASCTLSLADATVLHATLRTHHATSQSTELSMSDASTQSSSGTQISSQTQISSLTLDASLAPNSPTAGGLEALGR